MASIPQYDPAHDGPVFDWITRAAQRLREVRLGARTALQETRAATWATLQQMVWEREQQALQRAVTPDIRALRKARKAARRRRGLA
jgi:hypothetical protein